MTYYILRVDHQTGQREIVDEFDGKSEALEMVNEYQISDRAASYVTRSKKQAAREGLTDDWN